MCFGIKAQTKYNESIESQLCKLGKKKKKKNSAVQVYAECDV